MPLGGHTPLHPRWSEHHRAVMTGTQTGICRITRRTGAGTTDGSNVWHPSQPATIYEGTCWVTPPSPASHQVVGEQRIAISNYTVAIPWDAPEILEYDDVEVLTAADPQLPGRHLQVTDPIGGGGNEQWERVLTCVQDLTNRER